MADMVASAKGMATAPDLGVGGWFGMNRAGLFVEGNISEPFGTHEQI
jgi:hypothetical protein